MNNKRTMVLAACIVLSITAAACSNEATATEPSMAAVTTQATPAETSFEARLFADASETAGDLSGISDQEPIIPAENVQDDNDDPVHIYAFSEDLRTQIDSLYLPQHPEFRYDYQSVSYPDYEKRLDALFSSADQMPDIIMLDASFADQYKSSSELLGIDRLGISLEELTDQYDFSHQYMTDSAGAVKALAWQVRPIGVFYNRTVAKTYLGSSNEEDVSAHFSTWDALLETARTVNENSGGSVKAVADIDSLCKGYLFSRPTTWIQNNTVVWDQYTSGFLDFYRALAGENLTFGEDRGSDAWWAHGADQTVLAYFMTYEDFSRKMGFSIPAEGEKPDPGANPTSGDWALCEAPSDYFMDGIWLAATSDNDKRATTAELFRYFTISKNTLRPIADTGFFVNSKSVMDAKAKAEANNDPFLGGQNAYGILTKSAGEMNVSYISERDDVIEAVFLSLTRAYTDGSIPDIHEAEEIFLTDCEDLGLAKP